VTRGGVLVTGASSGIGAAIACELVVRGFSVFGTIRRPEDGAELAAGGVVPVQMDVTDAPSIAAARVEVQRALGGRPLSGLVNNAGIPAAGPLELVPLGELRRVLEVNLVGAVAVTQAFLPLLKPSRGRIVNMSSLAGRAALPFMGPYAASKFGLEAISDSLRRELSPFGVDVIVIEPGNIQSKIWDKVEAMDLGLYRGTPYERVLERFRNEALRGGRRAPPATIVARAVLRALTARRPPARIIVSAHPWIEGMVVRLPDRVLDWVVGRMVWGRLLRIPASD
jgi:NAD(P)-dependent dehydrogenase (short-subunit alcohol dehydrogenase family)